MSGGSKTTTTSSNQVDPALMALYNQNYVSAQKVAGTPFQPYTGELVAPMSATQQQGNTALVNAANSNVGAPTLDQAVAGTKGVLGYSAPTITPNSVTAPLLAKTDLSPYLNPYVNDVVNTTLAGLQKQYQQARVADNQAATKAGAFGGTRQAVRDALTSNDYLTNVANTTANLYNTGFDKAQTAALADIQNQIGTGEFNAGQDLASQTSNAANSIAGQNVNLSAANQLANLSNEQLQQVLQNAGVIQSVGASQTAQQQAEDQAAYQEFLRQISYPVQQQQVLNTALGIIPPSTTQTSTSNTSSSGGILGALGAIGSLATGAGALGVKL